MSSPATTATAPSRDWGAQFARRTHTAGGGEITAILSLAGATDVITFSGGFPAPETFNAGQLAQITSRLIEQDAAVALQYSPTEGLAGLRGYLTGRLEAQEGVRPGPGELMVTSGGIDCMELVAKSFLDAGDEVVVEAPSYLGAIMAFRGFEARLLEVPVDASGLQTERLAALLRDGARPKLLYTIPDHQNPTGLTLPEGRRRELVELARRYGFLILEDVAYRELGFSDARPPSLWALAPDVVVQTGTFSKIFSPGVRLGWAAGPAEIIAQLAVAKQNSDQCSGALGQRMAEEYGRAGYLDDQIAAARLLYARRAGLITAALAEHMPDGVTWTTPRGGFFTWVTVPDGLDTAALAAAARAAQVAYVPGAPFYASGAGTRQLRLAYSRVDDTLISEGVRRLASLFTR